MRTVSDLSWNDLHDVYGYALVHQQETLRAACRREIDSRLKTMPGNERIGALMDLELTLDKASAIRCGTWPGPPFPMADPPPQLPDSPSI